MRCEPVHYAPAFLPAAFMPFNTTEELIAEIQAGRMIILMDDEDRENEGDFVMAAEHVKPEHINFMTRFGRGLVCMPMSQERCRQLNLPLMVAGANQSKFGTNFTMSIEAAEGVTTGISAADRAMTIQTAAKADASPQDIVQPGHIFPIMAQPGGVLTRAGHTEATVDLARLAGLTPAAVLIEILNEDGTMARRPDLEKIAAEHDLKLGTIADLIRYRVEQEQTIECVAQQEIDTHYGRFQLRSYLDRIDGQLHFVLSMGEITADTPCPVRVHYQDTISDLFAIKGAQKSWSLHEAMRHVASQQHGVIVILAHDESNDQLLQRLNVAAQQQPVETVEGSLRTIGTGARILQDLGVGKMQVLSPPKRMHALSGFGLEVVDYIKEPQ